MHLAWQATVDEVKNALGGGKGGSNGVRVGLCQVIAAADGVLGEGFGGGPDRTEVRVLLHAELDKDAEAVRPFEFQVMPSEEGLERLLGALLAVERGGPGVRRDGVEQDACRLEVVGRQVESPRDVLLLRRHR